jgi:hypothetical protein
MKRLKIENSQQKKLRYWVSPHGSMLDDQNELKVVAITIEMDFGSKEIERGRSKRLKK